MLSYEEQKYVDDETHKILKSVRDAYGLEFWEDMTGGGCMALVTRLESGHWLVATDEGLCSLRDRVFHEMPDSYGEARSHGWFVGIYPATDYWGYDGDDVVESIIEVTDYDARGDQLVEFVGRALQALASSR